MKLHNFFKSTIRKFRFALQKIIFACGLSKLSFGVVVSLIADDSY